ncbi:MAG TPA: response regulator, partial [Bryobacteraceae bacterium]|nr:response regulator [Bryobacteraceae bacterium]
MSRTGGDSEDSTVDQASAGGKIMVVDDDSANLRLLDFMLRQHGCEVRTYPRGAVALAAVEEDAPELILLDIEMPEMNGYEMCERLKSRPAVSEIPVIFMSALSETADKVKAFRSGAVDYVSKPFQFEEVHARVSAHIRLRRLQKQIENDNHRLQELVQVQVRQIAEAQMATIFAVAKLAEVRDGETGRHLERIQTLCRLLAAGLSEHPKYRGTVTANWIRNIFHASPLHDIGKVATPDRILLKPGPLTPEERAIMKAHAACGAETLEAVRNRYPDNEFLGMGIEVTRSHHEWWDGTGYPDGLAGEQIPLCARILAIVDCYDALRSSRRYK